MVINVKYNIIYIYFIYFWPAIEQIYHVTEKS